MALQKTFTKEDLTTGNYVRLENLAIANRQKSEADIKDFVPRAVLRFGVYVSEASIKESNATAFMELTYIVDIADIVDVDLSADWSTLAKCVYANKTAIPELADAEDLD